MLQEATIDLYSKLNRYFSFRECLSFFFQKAIDIFNRVVYNISIEKQRLI